MTAAIRILEGPNGRVAVQVLEHEPQWKTVAVLSPDALIVGTDGRTKPVREATDEEIIAAVAAPQIGGGK